MHEDKSPSQVYIESHVGPRAFAPRTREALARLGYKVIPAFSSTLDEVEAWRPALRIVDERQFDTVPAQGDAGDVPIILLTGARPLTLEDTRLVGRLRRPATLSSLYPLIQRCLERHPRCAPRVATTLSARVIRADQRTVGSVLSLSEGGCLFRGSEPIERGQQMNLQFALPESGLLTTRAMCVHFAGAEAGLAFQEADGELRRSIGHYVQGRLIESAAA